MPAFLHDGLSFNYLERGDGVPFLFQHGLGGDVTQPASLFSPPRGVRLLSFDFRAHGQTRPLGEPEKLDFASFGEDVRTFLDRQRIQRAVVGGVSLGAAVALHFTLKHPARVCGLVLSRPAWLEGPNDANARIYALIASLIRQHGAAEGLARFLSTPTYLAMREASADAALSLVGQFESPRAEEVVARLERIPRDAPCRHLAEVEAIEVPTLILANRLDPLHPFEHGTTLAQRIHGAELRELTPKTVSKETHASDVQRCISEFLATRFLGARSRGGSIAC